MDPIISPIISNDSTSSLQTPFSLEHLQHWQEQFYSLLKGQGKSANTLKNYRTDLECFNRYLSQLNASDAQVALAQFNFVRVQEYGKFLDEKYTSDNSRRRRVQALRIFFDYLVAQGFISENPVRKLPTSPKFLDIPRPTPMEDVKTLWSHLCQDVREKSRLPRLMVRRNQIIFLLVYGGGLKVSDLSQLSFHDIFEGEDARVLIRPFKRDPYTVPLPPIFNAVLAEYKVELQELKQKSQMQFDEVLFNANPYRILSGGLSPRGLEIIFEELRHKLNITLTPKSLRQACIFKWLCQDKKAGLIKEWMGVTPSYSLKLYKAHLPQNLYSDGFLAEIFHQFNQ